MPDLPPILGLHHVTAMASDLADNVGFYRDTLGMRLVKRTVNFDDPGSLHLYYGDDTGSPGSLVTFFVWKGATRGRIGPPQVDGFAIDFPRSPSETTDPDGQTIHAGRSDVVRLGRQVVRVREAGPTTDFARRWLGDAAETLDIVQDDAPPARQGAGTVHHIAFRVADDEGQRALRAALVEAGVGVSPVMERVYFRSIYFREPGGVLFEAATDGPGMTADEPIESLGEKLCLPPWMESERPAIEAFVPKMKMLG